MKKDYNTTPNESPDVASEPAETYSVRVQLSYDQVLGLAMQLSDKEKFTLSRALTSAGRALKLRELRKMFVTDEISENDILQECENVRQQLYDTRIRRH